MQQAAGCKMKPFGGIFSPMNSQGRSIKTSLPGLESECRQFIVQNHELIYTLLPLVDCIFAFRNKVIALFGHN